MDIYLLELLTKEKVISLNFYNMKLITSSSFYIFVLLLLQQHVVVRGEQVIATNEFDFGPAFNIGPGRYAAPGSVSNGESARKASTDRRRLSSWCHIGMKVYHKNSPENIGVITAMNGGTLKIERAWALMLIMMIQ